MSLVASQQPYPSHSHLGYSFPSMVQQGTSESSSQASYACYHAFTISASGMHSSSAPMEPFRLSLQQALQGRYAGSALLSPADRSLCTCIHLFNSDRHSFSWLGDTMDSVPSARPTAEWDIETLSCGREAPEWYERWTGEGVSDGWWRLYPNCHDAAGEPYLVQFGINGGAHQPDNPAFWGASWADPSSLCAMGQPLFYTHDAVLMEGPDPQGPFLNQVASLVPMPLVSVPSLTEPVCEDNATSVCSSGIPPVDRDSSRTTAESSLSDPLCADLRTVIFSTGLGSLLVEGDRISQRLPLSEAACVQALHETSLFSVDPYFALLSIVH